MGRFPRHHRYFVLKVPVVVKFVELGFSQYGAGLLYGGVKLTQGASSLIQAFHNTYSRCGVISRDLELPFDSGSTSVPSPLDTNLFGKV